VFSALCARKADDQYAPLHLQPPALGRLRRLRTLDASSNTQLRAPAGWGGGATLPALAALPTLRLLDVRRCPRVGAYGQGHAELLKAAFGGAFAGTVTVSEDEDSGNGSGGDSVTVNEGEALVVRLTTQREAWAAKEHAADRDATLIKSQIAPHCTGVLRRRLALVFGDTTDPARVEVGSARALVTFVCGSLHSAHAQLTINTHIHIYSARR
jgi:hypothetical protein